MMNGLNTYSYVLENGAKIKKNDVNHSLTSNPNTLMRFIFHTLKNFHKVKIRPKLYTHILKVRRCVYCVHIER